MTDIDPFDLDRALPSHQARLALEKKVNVYFVPGHDKHGNPSYIYAVCSAMLHEQFMECARDGGIPDYAVVVARGDGEPTAEVKERIKLLYGWDGEAV